jgi:hypothetical protein
VNLRRLGRLRKIILNFPIFLGIAAYALGRLGISAYALGRVGIISEFREIREFSVFLITTQNAEYLV